MKAPGLLATLRDRDIQVWADGEQLRCSAPMGALTAELREALRLQKGEILQFLRTAGSLALQPGAIVPLQPRGTRPPTFAFGGHNGDVFCFRALARHLGEEQPFYGLQPPGLDGRAEPLTRIEDLAAYFAAEIRAFDPNGPYVIAGFCAGGSVAFELARHLLRDGAAIHGLALFGAPYPTAYRRPQRLRKRLAAQAQRLRKHFRALSWLPLREKPRHVAQTLHRLREVLAPTRPAGLAPVLAHRAKVERAIFAALRRYVPGHFAGVLRLFLPCEEWAHSLDRPLRWQGAAERAETYFGPNGCSTDNMLLDPHAQTFAGLFRQCPGQVDGVSHQAIESVLQLT